LLSANRIAPLPLLAFQHSGNAITVRRGREPERSLLLCAVEAVVALELVEHLHVFTQHRNEEAHQGQQPARDQRQGIGPGTGGALRSSTLGGVPIVHWPLQQRDQRLELNPVLAAAKHLLVFPLESDIEEQIAVRAD
jgi:hypothetical protein